jgi:hypothetical protein
MLTELNAIIAEFKAYNPSSYTKGSYYTFQKEIAWIESEIQKTDARNYSSG